VGARAVPTSLHAFWVAAPSTGVKCEVEALAPASICWLDAAVNSRPPTVSNQQIADILEQVADRLESQHANIYRIDAYRAGAAVLRSQATSIQDLALTEGREGLDALPQIGSSLSASIDEIAHTGRLRMLERLDGTLSAVELFKTVPGIGEELAERIHRELDIDTLEALEVAAHDGRLDGVAGFGPRRLEAIRDILATMLTRSSRGRARRFEELRQAGAQVSASETAEATPDVGLLFEVDRQYREKVEADELPRIAPQRNNPEGAAWLPVLHTYQDGWHFTALFSNTDRAHKLGRARDWVVIYFERDGHEGQCTVVTEYRGPLTGRRVIRGREDEVAALEALSDR
jgi:DNA polymerase (family 10)